MPRVVVLTGAGISAESGLKTFRGAAGLWEGHRVEDVARPEASARVLAVFCGSIASGDGPFEQSVRRRAGFEESGGRDRRQTGQVGCTSSRVEIEGQDAGRR